MSKNFCFIVLLSSVLLNQSMAAQTAEPPLTTPSSDSLVEQDSADRIIDDFEGLKDSRPDGLTVLQSDLAQLTQEMKTINGKKQKIDSFLIEKVGKNYEETLTVGSKRPIPWRKELDARFGAPGVDILLNMLDKIHSYKEAELEIYRKIERLETSIRNLETDIRRHPQKRDSR